MAQISAHGTYYNWEAGISCSGDFYCEDYGLCPERQTKSSPSTGFPSQIVLDRVFLSRQNGGNRLSVSRPMLIPVKRRNLRSHLAEHLFDAIVHGELLPGERIIEGKLARQLGVAQSTLREALQELEHQGLITKFDNRGSFVTKLTIQDIDDGYAVRNQLEPLAAALAYHRMMPEHHHELVGLLERMEAASKRNDYVELSKTDLAFHQLIWKLSGNKVLERTLNLVVMPLWAFELIRLFSAPTYDFEKALEEHRILLTVLKTGGEAKVKKTFEAIMEIFRSQDVENLRALENAPRLRTARQRIVAAVK